MTSPSIDRTYIKFDKVVFNWPRSLSYSTTTKYKTADVQTLKLHLDTRNWKFQDDEEVEEGGKKKRSATYAVRNGAVANTAPTRKCDSLFLNRDSDVKNEGVELFIGHFSDMRMILLFSLGSIERFVQQLYDSKQTSKLLPLPELISMEQASTITSIENHVVTSQKQLKAMQQKVDKQNKRITHEENMSKWGKDYEHIRRIWQSEDHPTFIGFDVETWEAGHKDMLEVGWSIVGPHRQQETFHFIMEEAFADGRRNGRYVADNRRNFLFGKVLSKPLSGRFPRWMANGSEIAHSLNVGQYFMDSVTEHRLKGPVYIVFHDSKGDMQVMHEFGIDTQDWSYTMLEKKESGQHHNKHQQQEEANGDIPLSSIIDHQRRKHDSNQNLHPVYIIDTQLLFAAIRCNGIGEKKSLKNICIGLDVNDGNLSYFHNAANDAHYTAAALVKMAQGPHFTEMRGIAESRLAQEQERAVKAAKKVAPYSTKSWD